MKSLSTVLTILAVIGIGVGVLYRSRLSDSGFRVLSFSKERDLQDIQDLFKTDWYWLSARDYDVNRLEQMILTGSPNEYEPEYFGKMKFDVLREGDDFVGFVAYYMKNFHQGIVLFLAIKSDFRGKRYGQKLLMHGIQQLFDQDAQKVTLVTRVHNASARALYTRAGLQETDIKDGFIGFKVEK